MLVTINVLFCMIKILKLLSAFFWKLQVFTQKVLSECSSLFLTKTQGTWNMRLWLNCIFSSKHSSLCFFSSQLSALRNKNDLYFSRHPRLEAPHYVAVLCRTNSKLGQLLFTVTSFPAAPFFIYLGSSNETLQLQLEIFCSKSHSSYCSND